MINIIPVDNICMVYPVNFDKRIEKFSEIFSNNNSKSQTKK